MTESDSQPILPAMPGLHRLNKSLDSRSEVAFLNFPEKSFGWYNDIQIAVDGNISVPFCIHSSARELYDTDKEFEEMLVRQAKNLIAQFGDARRPEAWLEKGDDES